MPTTAHFTKKTYGGVITKVRKRLAGWKHKVSSKAVGSLLICTMTATFPNVVCRLQNCLCL